MFDSLQDGQGSWVFGDTGSSGASLVADSDGFTITIPAQEPGDSGAEYVAAQYFQDTTSYGDVSTYTSKADNVVTGTGSVTCISSPVLTIGAWYQINLLVEQKVRFTNLSFDDSGSGWDLFVTAEILDVPANDWMPFIASRTSDEIADGTVLYSVQNAQTAWYKNLFVPDGSVIGPTLAQSTSPWPLGVNDTIKLELMSSSCGAGGGPSGPGVFLPPWVVG